jgi:uncharacterized protein YodC (DUF2158 family)
MFKIGEAVTLRRNGRQMVVVEVDEPHPDYAMPEPRECICHWIEIGKLRAASFPCEALERASDTPSIPFANFELTNGDPSKLRSSS